MKLHDVIVKSARAGLTLIREDGTIEPGHNGLKMDPETSVRVNSHWSMIFLFAYTKTGEEVFKKAAATCLEYLFTKKARPHQKTFWARKNPKKDQCNGLMGQAFTIDALAYAHNITKDKRYKDLAVELFMLHPFEIKSGLWKKVEIDGKVGYFDLTLNHQLWFAAAASTIDDVRVKERVGEFLNHLQENMSVRENGLIIHEIFSTQTFTQKITSPLSKIFLFCTKNKKKRIAREKLYHFYNLYALAMIKNNFKDHRFWNNDRFIKAFNLALSENFRQELFENDDFWSAPIGIELTYVLETFSSKDQREEIEKWLAKEFEIHFDSTTSFLNKNVLDKNTVRARLYEAVRLQNYNINELSKK